MKELLERGGLTDSDRNDLADLIQVTGAFQVPSDSERTRNTEETPF